MSETTDLRLVELESGVALAWDYAVHDDGTKAAVVGPGAVQCPKCNAYQGKPCQTPDETPLGFVHLDRTYVMKLEISRLMTEKDNDKDGGKE